MSRPKARLLGFAFTEAALKFLETIPTKFRGQVIKKAKALMLDPHPNGYKQLKGIVTGDDEPVLRERSGDYRILYVVRKNPNQVVILDIDHRKDAYR